MIVNLSIKNKIIVIILIVTSFTTLLGFSIITIKNVYDMKSNMLEQSIRDARLLGDDAVTALTKNNPERAVELLKKLKSMPEYTNAQINNKSNVPFASYSRSGKTMSLPFIKGEAKHMFSGEYLHIYEPINYQGQIYGYIYLKKHTALYDKIVGHVLLMLLLMVAILGITFLLARRFQKIISAPILKLAGITGEISLSKDYSLRVETENEDEIGLLYDGFNSMLDVIADKEQERDRAEEEMKSSLDEKVILLKEIHHRVKNNMQVISSMLSLQCEHIKEEDDRRLFRNSQERILSMAMVHEMLYRSDDLSRVDFQNYISELVNSLRKTYLSSGERIKININAENVFLGIDIAIPCALIINELISNSMKYAFPGDSKGEINVDFSRDGDDRYVLTVADNGIGIDKNFEINNSDTLGFRLVNALTEQIDGEMSLENSVGIAVAISFCKK